MAMLMKKSNMIDAKIKEAEMLLEMMARDREKENDQKRKLKQLVKTKLQEIADEKHASDVVIVKRVEEKKNQEILECKRNIEMEERMKMLLQRRYEAWEKEYRKLATMKEQHTYEIFEAEKLNEK